jgi:ketosteroid isomerase-like protein
MSQENVEAVRRFVDHYNETGEPLWELIDPELVYTIDPPAWLAGTYHGHEGLKSLIRQTAEVFDEFRFEVEEFRSAGDSVVGLGDVRVRGAQSGATAFARGGAVVARMRGGRILEWRVYYDRHEALEAAGLRE